MSPMRHRDHFHCDLCGAEFATESDVKEHEQSSHSRQAAGSDSAIANPESGDQADGSGSERKHKTFTRSHRE